MTLSVALFNATGAQGAPVVTAAVAAGHRVRAVARDAAAVTARHGDAVAAWVADFDDTESLARALQGVDAAFAHLPIPHDADAPARQLGNFLAAARRAQLPLLVWSTSGPTAARWGDSPATLGNRGGVAALLGSGVPTIVLQPSVYLENLLVPPFLPRLDAEGVIDYPPISPRRRLSWTSHQDQARIAVAALERPDLAGRSVEIASDRPIDGAELAALLQPWAGRALRFEPATPAAFGDHLGRLFGNPGAGAAIGAMYGAMDAQPPGATVVDAQAAARTFGVTLPTLEALIGGWPSR